jgi:hypothetical protein
MRGDNTEKLIELVLQCDDVNRSQMREHSTSLIFWHNWSLWTFPRLRESIGINPDNHDDMIGARMKFRRFFYSFLDIVAMTNVEKIPHSCREYDDTSARTEIVENADEFFVIWDEAISICRRTLQDTRCALTKWYWLIRSNAPFVNSSYGIHIHDNPPM